MADAIRNTQVTYPYIMAKTRLQAGDDDEDDETEWEKRHAAGQKHKERYNGAIDCLRQVYNEEGFFGWYQVRPPSLVLLPERAPALAGPGAWTASADPSCLVSLALALHRECKLRSPRRSCRRRSSLASRTRLRPVRCSRALLSSALLPSLTRRHTSAPADTILTLVAIAKVRGSAVGLKSL